MKSTYKERLNRVTFLQSIVSNVGTLESGKAEPQDIVVTGLLELLLAVDAPETVLIVDESESMRVVASNPKLHSDKINVARLTADIANCLTQNEVRSCNLIRLGGTGPAGNRRTSPSAESRSPRAFGKTPKSEKTAYVLRNALIRVSSDAQFIVMSDFRSHMWRRNLNALIAACPRVTLVHLVDVVDCDFVMSSDEQIHLATQPDPSPWSTPLVDSMIPPSDMHAYLTAFCELNDISLMGIVVQEHTLDDIVCTFERAFINA